MDAFIEADCIAEWAQKFGLAATLTLLEGAAQPDPVKCQFCAQVGHEVRECQTHHRLWVQLSQKVVIASRWKRFLGGFWWLAIGFVAGVLVGKGSGL